MLAEKVYMATSYLSHIFKKDTGQNLSKFIKAYRMEKAKEMLEETHEKIVQISYAVGYPNVSYFCQSFREFYGVSPQKFRMSGEEGQSMQRKWNYLLRLFRNMKFRNKLMLTYFIIGIGPVVLLGTFCFFQTKNILVEREQENLQTSLIQSVADMDNQIKIYNNLSDYSSYNQTISEVIGYYTQF